jgi:hypothetical protein
MQVHCPKCDADITETYEASDPSVGVYGGWYCESCDLGVGEHEVDREPLEGDVEIPPTPQRDGPIGTPISQISGRPGEPGYAEFCRIARSWGHE